MKVSEDLDGDGEVSSKEISLCRICLMAALVLAFGEQAVGLI